MPVAVTGREADGLKQPLKGVMEVGWRLYVLDVASGEEHPLNQVSRSVDDQVDWFDNDHIVYHDSAPAGHRHLAARDR